MTEKERLWAAFCGGHVDRAPIWLREGMPVAEGPAGAEDFSRGWQAEAIYREMFAHVAPHAGEIENWGVQAFNRLLMTPPKFIHREAIDAGPDVRRFRDRIRTPRGELEHVTEMRRGQATSWTLKYAVESREDLKKLASIPFELDPSHIPAAIDSYRRALQRVGDRGVVRLNLHSPIVAISGSMPFELFLELSVTEKAWFRELCEEITRRELAILDAVLAAGEFQTTANIGGCEQCTPPIMSPRSFDEYVVPYDGQLIRRLHREGVPVNVHCHGKVRHALSCMLAMGVDATDPVEPPPAGDVTYVEARQIVGDRMTLVGNLEFSMLEHAEADEVRRHVRDLLSRGCQRLILAASAGPISGITPRLAANYKAWIDASLEFNGR